MTEMVSFWEWRGTPLFDLSKEELIEALEYTLQERSEDKKELARRRKDAIWVVPEAYRRQAFERSSR